MVRLWGNASIEERRALYRLCRALIDQGDLDWNTIYGDALRRPAGMGKGYQDNFRAGKISRRNAASIAGYLAEHFPHLIDELPLPPPTRALREWSALLERSPKTNEGLSVVAKVRQRTYVVPTTLRATSSYVMPRCEFHLILQVQSPTTLFLLHRNEWGNWTPVPLDARALPYAADAGFNGFPRDRNNDLKYLALTSGVDDQSFALVIASRTVGREIPNGWNAGLGLVERELNELAHRISNDPNGRVMQIGVRIDESLEQIIPETWQEVG